MRSQIYGYVRVSSTDQNEDRQMRAMEEKYVPPKNIYVDKQSGKDFQRPQYQNLVRRLAHPLPENFPCVYQDWKAGAITGVAAARECGMPLSSFRYRAAHCAPPSSPDQP